MRLTLRTLLAWLDDTLPPSQVREIGKQVSETTYARELVDRIHRVTRQRRLMVPSKNGPDATDPNVVASYVDNDLEPDQVAEYEKRCLNSDVNLAEVASVHQILSLLGQKVNVPAEAKARMYQLVKGRESIPKPKPDGVKPARREPVTQPIQPWVAPPPPRGNLLERFGPLAACLGLLAILCVSAYKSLTPVQPESGTVKPLAAAAAPSAAPEAGKPAGADESGAPAEPTPAGGRVVGPAPADTAAAPAPGAAEGSTEHAQPLVATKEAAGGAAPTPSPEKAGGKPESTSETAKTGPAKATPPKEVPAGAIGIVDTSKGILLRFNADRGDWDRITEGTALAASDRILCLSPFRARIILAKAPIVLVGETQIRLLTDKTADTPAFDLVEGRALIDGSAPSGSVKVDFGGQTLAIDAPSQARVGLERLGQWVNGQVPAHSPPLAIYSADGELKLALGQAKQTLEGPGTVVAEATGRFQARSDKNLPGWMTETEPSEKDQKLGEAFAQQFAPDQPVSKEMVVAMDSESPVTRKLAIFGLKALGDLSFLTPILDRKKDPVSRQNAAAALRSYLAQGPQAVSRLRAQLEVDFGEQPGRTLEKLLIGYSAEEGAKKETQQRLLDLASPRSPSLPHRELAIENLKTITGRDAKGYDPEEPDEKAYNAWRSQLMQGEIRAAPKRKTAG
jgi:hypothetical protein